MRDGDPVPARHTIGDAYIIARLGGLPLRKIELLDTIESLDEVIVALENVGTAQIFGRHLSYGKIPDERYAEVLSAGIEVFQDWPRSFEQLAQRIDAASARDNRSAVDRYGPIYLWAKQLSPSTPFGSEVRTLLANLHGEDGRFLIKGFLSKHASLTGLPTNQAARELGVSYSTFRCLANRLGIHSNCLGRGSPARTITLDALDKMRRTLANLITADQAATKLEIFDASPLRKQGLLTPIRTNDRLRSPPRYDRREVDLLIARLSEGCVYLDEIPENCMPLSGLNRGRCCSIALACGMILDGTIRPRGVLRGVTGLPGIVVDTRQLLKALRTKAGAPYMICEAAEQLDLADGTVRQLVKAGFISSVRVDRRRLGISEEAIKEFRSKFITSKDLNAAFGTTPRQLAIVLSRAGLTPLISPTSDKRCKTSIFGRASFPEDLAGWWRDQCSHWLGGSGGSINGLSFARPRVRKRSTRARMQTDQLP